MKHSISTTIVKLLNVTAVAVTAILAPAVCLAQVVEVDPAITIGPTIVRAGWDIKAWPTRLNTVGEARGLYVDVDANFLRIPFFATAHNADGAVDASEYSTELDAIASVLAVRPDVEIYASLKLQGANTFPAWVSQPTANWPAETGGIFGNSVDRPNPEHYSTMVADYVKYLQDNGIRIDYLGLNNETEGAIPVDRYIGTFDLLPGRLAAAGVTSANSAFQFVGPDTFSIFSARSFVNSLRNLNRLDTIDFAASHYYPQHSSGSESNWLAVADFSGKPLWHTEVHMPGNDDAIDELSQTLRDSLSVLFGSFRNGVDSYIWWDSGNSLNEVRDVIKREVTTATLGAAPVLTTPSYAAKGDADGLPLFQAFVEDDQVTLWIANPGGDLNNLPVDLLSSSLGNSMSGLYYRAPNGDNNLTASDTVPLTFVAGTDGIGFTINHIPGQSVAVVSFDVVNYVLGDCNQDGFVNFLDIAPFIEILFSGPYLQEADCNQDGFVSFFDIAPFIAILASS